MIVRSCTLFGSVLSVWRHLDTPDGRNALKSNAHWLPSGYSAPSWSIMQTQYHKTSIFSKEEHTFTQKRLWKDGRNNVACWRQERVLMAISLRSYKTKYWIYQKKLRVATNLSVKIFDGNAKHLRQNPARLFISLLSSCLRRYRCPWVIIGDSTIYGFRLCDRWGHR